MAMDSRRVLCTGLTFCDFLFVGLESLPLPGMESKCRNFAVKAGGAANTPMALARLGVEALGLIKESCPGRVAVMLGPRGALMSADAPGVSPVAVPAARPERVVDPTGAGDLFAAGFPAGRCWGWDDRRPARLASASGALAVSFAGGMDTSYAKESVLSLLEGPEEGAAP